MNRLRQTALPAILFPLLVLFTSTVLAQSSVVEKYGEVAERIRVEGLRNGQAFPMLKMLTEQAGSRLAGSPGAAAAVELTRQLMLDMGLNVHLEATEVPHWVRGEEEARIINSRLLGTQRLSVCALGGSVGTPSMGISAPVVEVHSFEELEKLGEEVRGKIVFFNRPMDVTLMNTFSAYGGAVNQRTNGASEAAKWGAVAVLIRSMTTRVDDVPHTGMMRYMPNVAKIPAAAVSLKGANQLSELLETEKEVRLYLRLTCKSLRPVMSANVVGDIPGSEKPDEIVLLGGHLDSWDLGAGAHDDGSGCVHALEALRLIKSLGLVPKRTIRAVMYMNEEFGASGGRDYADSPHRDGEVHIAAIESDRGGFMPVGFGVSGDESAYQTIQSWLPLFQPIKLQWIRRGGGGADIGPLAKKGTVLMGLVVEDQRYFDVHHSANDILEAVNGRELELGAIAMAIMAYLLAQEGI